MIDLDIIRTTVDTANTATYVRTAFVSMGVEAANIKSVHASPGGFSKHPNRVCVTLHRAVRLSANTVNGYEGLSGAVWTGNVCHVIVGKGE